MSRDPHLEAPLALLRSHYSAKIRGRVTLTAATNGISGAGVWQVVAGEASDAGPWALRRWPLHASDPVAIARIHAVLHHARQRGLDFVPAPIESDAGGMLVERAGCCWEMAPWMPGAAAAAEGPVEKLTAALAALAEFHEAVALCGPTAARAPQPQPSPAIGERARRLDRAISQDWRLAAETAIAASGAHADAWRRMAESLPAATRVARDAVRSVAGVPVRLQPVIRDTRREHFLFSERADGEARVTGLVDFGGMAVDSRAVDVARLVGDWSSVPGPIPVLAGLDPEERRLIGPLDASGVVLACANWLRWAAERRPIDGGRLAWLGRRLPGIAAGRLLGA